MLWKQLVVCAPLFVEALSLATGHVLHEKRTVALPHKRERIDSNAIIPIQIGLRQSNLHTGYDRLSKNQLFSQDMTPSRPFHLTPHSSLLEFVNTISYLTADDFF